MSESRGGVESREAREGSCLVRVEKAYMPGQERETRSDYSFKYFGSKTMTLKEAGVS